MEIAEEMGIPHADIVFAMDAIQDPVSLFEPIYNDGGDPIFVMDQLSDDKEKDATWVDNLSIKEGMYHLNERENMILNKRFFQGKTQMEVAAEIGISQSKVSRLSTAAIDQRTKQMIQ